MGSTEVCDHRTKLNISNGTTGWERQFNNNACSLPIEMFIQLMEKEGLDSGLDSDQLICHTMSSINPNLIDSPLKEKQLKGSWKDLKDYLMKRFGQEDPFTMEQKLQLLNSLVKGQCESLSNFLVRVKFVVKVIGEEGLNQNKDQNNFVAVFNHSWSKVLFLHGMHSSESESILQGIQSGNAEADILTFFNHAPFVDLSGQYEMVIKQEDVKEEMNESAPHYGDLDTMEDDFNGHSGDYEEKLVDVPVGLMGAANVVESDEEDTKPLILWKSGSQGSKEKKDVLNCHVCHAEFRTRTKLMNHLTKWHSLLLDCKLCDEKFASRKLLNDHCQASHNGQNVKIVRELPCGICGESFSKKVFLREHCRAVHEGKMVKCLVCEMELSSKTALDLHIKSFHSSPDKELPSRTPNARRSYCLPLKPGEESPLKGIYMTVTRCPDDGKLTYHCGLCDQTFDKRSKLNEHTKSAHNGNIAKCDRCNFVSATLHRTVLHRLAHHDLTTPGFPIYSCDYDKCAFKALSQKCVDKHVDSVHKKILKAQCSQCGNRFTTKGALTLHLQTVHMGLKRHKCEHCGEAFKSVTILKSHVNKVHLNIQPPKIVCEECGEEYGHMVSYKYHVEKVHQGLKRNFKCDHCDKTFYTMHLKECHQRVVHRIGKLWGCPECDRFRKSKFELKKHIAIAHLDVKPYRCGICSTYYVDGSKLGYHICIKHLGMTQKEYSAHPAKAKITQGHAAFEYQKPVFDELLIPFYKKWNMKPL